MHRAPNLVTPTWRMKSPNQSHRSKPLSIICALVPQVERLFPGAVDWSYKGGVAMPPWGEADKPDAYNRYLRSIKRLAGASAVVPAT
eukprot:5982149-Pyramimonas_sp.AAC.1